MEQKIRTSREILFSILALEGIGSIGSIIAGRLKHWKGCRKIGRLEAMQEDWKARCDAGRLDARRDAG